MEIDKQKKESPDLVELATKAGKAVCSIFKRTDTIEPKAQAPPKVEPQQVAVDPRIKDLVDPGNHNTTIGDVYANDKARTNFFYNQPDFPVGSIIVREKYFTLGSPPETIIAMVKREKGFNDASGDWEFFVFNGRDMALTSRESVGSCATCHARAKDTDWTFRTYMNFSR